MIMKNIDSIADLVQAQAREEFSVRADGEFCELMEYGIEFRKKFMNKRMNTFS
jgi:hypothetical protein